MKFDIQHAGATQTVSSTNGSLDAAEMDVSAVRGDCHRLTEALGAVLWSAVPSRG